MCLCHSFGVVTVVIVPPSDGVSFRVAVRVSVCCHCARTETLMSLLLPLLTLPRINRKTTLNQYKKKNAFTHARSNISVLRTPFSNTSGHWHTKQATRHLYCHALKIACCNSHRQSKPRHKPVILLLTFFYTSSSTFVRNKGSIGCVFTVCICTENQNQTISPLLVHITFLSPLGSP